MSGYDSSADGNRDRVLILRDSSKGEQEKDELGQFLAAVVGVVLETDEQHPELVTESRTGFFQPRNWHHSTSKKPISPDFPNLKDQRLSVALISDHQHKFAWDGTKPDEVNFLVGDHPGEQKSTRIVDYNADNLGQSRSALLASLTKVTDDHLQEYTAALVLGRSQPADEGGVIAAGYVHALLAHDAPYNGLLDTFWKANPADQEGTGREGTPYGILGARHDAHFELDDDIHHGRIRFEATELTGYSEPAGWPLKFKSEMRSDTSTANTHSDNKHENNEWRPFYEATFFVPEIPPPPITDGPGTPVYPPGDPGVPVPGGGTGVVIALPLMDNGAPNTTGLEDVENFGYIGLTRDTGTGEVTLYVSGGSAGSETWAAVGGGTGAYTSGGDGRDGAVTFDGSAVTGATLASTTYTLTKSFSFTDCTISSGYTVKTNGHAFRGTGALVVDGTIDRSGGDATSTSGGAAPGGSMLLGLAGATGRTTVGNGAGGSSATAGIGGNGGNGGSTSGGSAGTGGVISAPASTTMPPYNSLQAALNNGRMSTLTGSVDPSGGCSGGAGAFETGATGRSGSGGGSGGILILSFNTIAVSATGSILARGGNAYAAAGTGDLGGGGGGGGGAIYLITASGTYTNAGTISVAGGALANGLGAGTNGTAGADGQIIELAGCC